MRFANTVGVAIGIALALISTSAFAGSSSTSSANSGSASYAGVNIQNNGATRLKTVGNAIAPGLIAGGLSCAGSTSVAGGFMGGAFSFGMTTMDKDCNTRENAKMFGIMGDKALAIEIMCDSPQVLAADARMGRGVCLRNRGQRTVRGVVNSRIARVDAKGRAIKQTPYP